MAEHQPASYYRGESGKAYHEIKRGIPERALPWVSRLRAEKFAHYVHENQTVLEYGVGSGWNLAQLKCKRKLGFDVSDFLAPKLQEQGIEFVSDTKSLAENSVDLVICHHTLEHVLNPAETLLEIRRLLRPSGKLLLFVPFEREKKYRKFDPAEPNHHLYSWNVQTLGNLVSEMQFSVVEAKIGEFGYDRFAAVWANKFKLGETGFRLIRRAIHLVRPGCEVRIVAVKK